MPETTQFGGSQDLGVEEGGSLKANTILMARYKILGVVGGGGQGAVYQCRDLNFPDAKRLVAIKEMHYPSGDPSVRSVALATFQREANILATLSHPAIPKIFDFFDQNNRAYIVMEYIHGSDLELLLSKTKELPMEKIIDWAIELCDVFQYLHNHQPEPIIFRDVKPANIMIDSLGKVRLIDFGIAKVFVSGIKNTMIGTEGYSAPEQYRGDVSPLSDVYSLGATLHHIITRKDPRLEPPFSFHERPLQNFNPQATPEIGAVIMKAVEMDSKNRYQSCGEMKEALLTVRYGGKKAVGPGGPGGMVTGGAAGMTGKIGSVAASTTIFKDGDNKAAQLGGETGLFEDLDVIFGGTLEPRWRFKTEDEIRSGPVAANGMAFVGSYDTNMWAVDLETGEFRWKYATNGGIASGAVADPQNKLVMFGSEDHTYYAVDMNNGRIAWTFQTQDRIRSTGRLAHDHIFFGSDDGRVYALSASNGRKLWQYDMGAPVRGKPFVTDELIIAGSEDGELVGIQLSGDRKWNYRLRRNITASPVVDEVENVCYVGCFDGYLYALDGRTGYSMWRFRTGGPIISAVAMDGSTLFFGSADGNFYAINAENAKERWHFTLEKPIVSSPIYHKEHIYFGGTDGSFYCLEAKTGREVWKYETGKSITAAPYIVANMVLFGSMDNTLYAVPLVGN